MFKKILIANRGEIACRVIKTLIAKLIGLLPDAGRSDIKVFVGGVIPPQDYDFLREAGVVGIYGPGNKSQECAADVLRLLGYNMPPVGE